MLWSAMSVQVASEYDNDFRQDVNDLFRLFTLPRREFAAMGETGFFDMTDSFSFGELLLKQVRKNIKYIIREHFGEESEELVQSVDDVLGNYMGGGEEISVTFYLKPRLPIGIKIENDFTEGKKIATIERSRGSNEVAFSETDSEMFDWLYGTYTQGRTDLYGEYTYSMTLSIRNTREYVDYSVKAENYDSTVQNLVEKNKKGIFGRLSV